MIMKGSLYQLDFIPWLVILAILLLHYHLTDTTELVQLRTIIITLFCLIGLG
jgi:uncharacterized membrane protein YccC